MKQYEMNEEIVRNLKSDINTELHVCMTDLSTFVFD